MKLYSSLGPNPRLARMFLVEKGIEVERIHLDIITGENRSGDYAKKNVMQTTPTLELEDGTLISESTVICEYLEEIQPDPVLIGSTPEERAETRRWARRIDQEIAVPMDYGISRRWRTTDVRAAHECRQHRSGPPNWPRCPTSTGCGSMRSLATRIISATTC